MSLRDEAADRRLAAVWFADIVEFTRLAGRDEDRAMELVAVFQETVRESLERFGGHLVKFLGDGALAEFRSAESAARAALDLCGRFQERAAASANPATARIGVHLGEILASADGDVYGDGVNVASRLQSVAGPGRVVVSEDVYRQLRRRSEFRLRPIGERRLKGIDEPIRIYELEPTGAREAGAAKPAPSSRPARRALRTSRARAGLAVLLVAIAGVSWWMVGGRQSAGGRIPAGRPTSLAVLPFQIVGDPGGESFSDGLTSEIRTALARIPGLRVISRSSSIRYRSTAKPAREIAEELGVDALLEGNIQRQGERVRIAVSLVDARNDRTLWAQGFDRDVRDLLAVQRDIALHIADALEVRLSPEEAESSKAPRDPRAYDLYLRGRGLLARHTERDTRAAIEAFEEALEIDPEYAAAHAGLALAASEMHLRFAPGGEVEAWGARAVTEAERALAIYPDLAIAHEALAGVLRRTDFNWERVIQESTRAIELDPSLAAPHYYLAAAFYHLGLLDLAEREVRAGMQLDPLGDRVEPMRALGVTLLLAGRYAEADTLLEQVRDLSEGRVSDTYLAQAKFYTGDVGTAERLLTELLRSSSASAASRAQVILAGVLTPRDSARARALVRETISAGYVDHHVAYGLGTAYAGLGDPAEAVRWLREAAETGFPCYPWYETDPLLGSIRAEPAFRSLLAELRSSWEAARHRYGGGAATRTP